KCSSVLSLVLAFLGGLNAKSDVNPSVLEASESLQAQPHSVEAALAYAETVRASGDEAEGIRIASIVQKGLLKTFEQQGPSGPLYFSLSRAAGLQGKLYLSRSYLLKALQAEPEKTEYILALAQLD